MGDFTRVILFVGLCMYGMYIVIVALVSFTLSSDLSDILGVVWKR